MHGRGLSKLGPPATFTAGLLVLAAMAFVSAWPDMEASVFDAGTASVADRALHALQCPVLITPDETANVSARFHNDTDRLQSFLVRARVSHGYVTLVRQNSQQVRLRPGESVTLTWPVRAEDAAYGRLILVRVLAMSGPGRPARQSSCGVLVAGVPGVSGQVLFSLGVIAGLGLLIAGAAWWSVGRRPLNRRDARRARRAALVAVAVAASLVTGLAGWWLLSHLLLIGSALLVLVVLEQEVAARV
jgi:hypothetical protein